MIFRIVSFLILNFSALYLGIILSGQGGSSNWYSNLNRAPWEPDGWVFGAAWTIIMICFSIYMAQLSRKTYNKLSLFIYFTIQYILNISWNPVFFKYNFTLFGFIIIISLTVLVGYFLLRYLKDVKYYSIFLLPYFIWLIIASSLNGYICMYN